MAIEKITLTDDIWLTANEYCQQFFPSEIDSDYATRRFWVEGHKPNLQGLLGELAFVGWLGYNVKDYLEMRPKYRRDKGRDLIVGNYKIDIKTSALKVPPKPYHRVLLEDILIERRVADLYVCQFIVKPEMQNVYIMGFATPEDVMAFGVKKQRGEVIFGTVTAGYNGYLIDASSLRPATELKEKLNGLDMQDTITHTH